MACQHRLLKGVSSALMQPLSQRSNGNGFPQIVSPRLDNIIQYPSPNWNSRNGQRVVFLIEHYTAEDKESALKRLTDPAAQVSSHYLVDEEGAIYQLVAENNRAWHAGFGSWDGYTDINSVSIGIEIVNPGDAPYTQSQMDAVKALSLDIALRYGIPPTQVLGHSDVAVTTRNHKSDPGWFFDWQGVAAHGAGVWPEPIQGDYDNSAGWSNDDLKRNLAKYGYTADATVPVLIEAFQRHFQQEVAQTSALIGVADAETRARLAFLLRFKSERHAVLSRHSQWWQLTILRLEKLNNAIQSL